MFMGFFSVANAITLFGLVSSLTACFLAANGNVKFAIYMMFLTCICDLLDKKFIRGCSTPKQKYFATQLIDLVKLVNFGVVPCFIAFSFGFKGWFDILIYGLFILAAAIRVANFKALESAYPQKRFKRERGLPLAASIYAITFIFLLTTFMPAAASVWFSRLIFIALAVAFVLNIKIKKPNPKQALIALGIELLLIIILLVAGDLKAPNATDNDASDNNSTEISETV